MGKYNAHTAAFLESDGKVLPVPVPAESVAALEQAMRTDGKPPPVLNVLMHARSLTNREGGLFDQLPWQWAPSPLSKRDGFARLGGRDYPRGDARHASPYHLLLEMLRRDVCASVARVIVVDDTAKTADRSSVVVGSRVLLRQQLPEASASELKPSDARRHTLGNEDVVDTSEQGGDVPCGCAPDEGLGLAMAACSGVVHVELSVWEAAARSPTYGLLQDQMRIVINEDADADVDDDERRRLIRAMNRAEARSPPTLPQDIASAEELRSMPLADKARSAPIRARPSPVPTRHIGWATMGSGFDAPSCARSPPPPRASYTRIRHMPPI